MNKTIIGLIIAGILLISIPVGVRLVQQQQILKSKAAEDFSVDCGQRTCGDPPGQQYTLMCTNSCDDSPQNQCVTNQSCGEPVDCRNGVGCPGNVSCPPGSPNGVVRCNEDNGVCYSDCSVSTSNVSCPPDGGYYWDGTVNSCIHKTGGVVWTTDNQCHYNYEHVAGTATNCPGTSVSTPVPTRSGGGGGGGGAGGTCTVSNWSFTPLGGGLVRATVKGVSSPSWGNIVYKRQTDSGWVTTNVTVTQGTNGPTFSFNVSEGSGQQTVTLGANNGAIVCSPQGTFGGSGGGGGGSGLTKIYVEPNPVAPGADVKITATAPASCSTNINMSAGAGIVGCGDAMGQTCSGGSPKSDNNPCWWQWQCKGGTTAGTYTATFNASGTNCSSSISYSVTATGGGGSAPTACPSTITSTLIKFSTEADTEPRDIQSIALGSSVIVGAFNGITTATDVSITLENLTAGTLPQTIANSSTFKPTRAGTYKFIATMQNTDGVSYTGANCTKTVNLVVTAGAATATPTPTPSDACDLPADKAVMPRMRISDQQLWSSNVYASAGNTINFAGFYGTQTSEYGSDIDLTIYGPINNGDRSQAHTDQLNTSQENPVSKVMDIAGDYIVTAKKHGKKGGICESSGSIANLHMSGAVTTTKEYRVSENLADFTKDPSTNPNIVWKPYTSDGMLVSDFSFTDRDPGQKLVYVEFKDNNGKEGGCGADFKPTSNPAERTHPCAMPIKLLEPARISTCFLTFEGSNTILNLQGNNFGVSNGKVVGNTTFGLTSGSNLPVKTWDDGNVSVSWFNAPQGKTLYVNLTTASGLQAQGTCSPVASLVLSTKAFCSCHQSIPNVDLTLQEAVTGNILVNQKVTIGADGTIQGLNQKLTANTTYNLSIKAPKYLRKNRSFTVPATGGTVNIPDFVLVVGDIYEPGGESGKNPAPGEGKAKITSQDYAMMVREWNPNGKTANKASDLNCDFCTNSVDYACLRHNLNSEGDPPLIAGVVLINPSETPAPGTTGTPAPGVCTLGMYVRFDGLNAFSAAPSVSLVLFPPTTDPGPNTDCKAENGCSRFSVVPVVPATDPRISNPNKDVFLITNGSNPLSCGASYNVVVLNQDYKKSIFYGVKVTSDPGQYATFLFNNNKICKASDASCNNNCLRNDPVCVTH